MSTINLKQNVKATEEKTVNFFKELNYKWGGDFPGKFKDYPHLEKRGYSIRQLYNLYQKT